ncbi:MAG: transcriptional regulator [Pirellulaceae bacterium]|nr:transcriptional regulator [Pirellulaceae bacterium]
MNATPEPDRESTGEMPPEVLELAAAIATLPAPYRVALDPSLKRVLESSERRRRILNLVQDALSQLRLDMKYLVFDLEATRRERDRYRQQLDELSDRGASDE